MIIKLFFLPFILVLFFPKFLIAEETHSTNSGNSSSNNRENSSQNIINTRESPTGENSLNTSSSANQSGNEEQNVSIPKPYYFTASGFIIPFPKVYVIGGGKFSFNYILGNNPDYSPPNIELGISTSVATTSFKIGPTLLLNVFKILTISVHPYYTYGWRYYEFAFSTKANYNAAKDLLYENRVSIISTISTDINTVIKVGPLSFHNDLIFRNNNKRVLDMPTLLLVKNEPVWKFAVSLGFPFSIKYKIFGQIEFGGHQNIYFPGENLYVRFGIAFINLIGPVGLNLGVVFYCKSTESPLIFSGGGGFIVKF